MVVGRKSKVKFLVSFILIINFFSHLRFLDQPLCVAFWFLLQRWRATIMQSKTEMSVRIRLWGVGISKVGASCHEDAGYPNSAQWEKISTRLEEPPARLWHQRRTAGRIDLSPRLSLLIKGKPQTLPSYQQPLQNSPQSTQKSKILSLIIPQITLIICVNPYNWTEPLPIAQPLH